MGPGGGDGAGRGWRAASAALLQRLLDHVPAMLAYWDADGRNVVANAAYREWFGLEPAAIRGMHMRDLLGEEVYAQNLPYIEGALSGEEQFFDRTLTDAGGRVRRTQAAYIPDVVDGDTAGFFVLVTDVTARFGHEQAAARAAGQFRALARSLPDAFVMLFDDELRYRIADGQGLRSFGLVSVETEGRTMPEVLPERAEELEPRYRAALQGATSRWIREVGGRVYALTASPVTTGDGEVAAGMVVGVDVTSERRAAASRAAVHALALAAARRAPLQEVADLVASSAQSLLRADQASVVCFEGDDIHVVALRPARPVHVERIPNDGSSASSVVATTGQSCVLDHPTVTAAGGPLADMPVAVGIAVPVRLGDQLWGAVGVGAGRDFEDRADTLRLLEEFADLVSLAIGTSQAWDDLDRKARVDPLTSLPNRRVFDERLAVEVARAARTGTALGLLIVDLDHFKEVNDRLGHQAGDAVLVEAARRLASTARGYELVARLGGEEFVVLTTEPDDLASVADRFRGVVGDHAYLGGVTVTASVGAAVATGAIEPAEVVRRADRALYAAKAAGRDRTVVDDPPVAHGVPG